MEKLTVLGLGMRKLDRTDVVSLSVYAGLMLAAILFPQEKLRFIIGFICAFFSFYMVCTTSFGLRFKSLHFSLFWLVSTIIFVFTVPISIAWFPLGIFFYYHMVRAIFWSIHHREFIPQTVGRGGVIYRHRSQLEGRSGVKADKIYMKILLLGGIGILMCCIFGLVGTKFS